MAPRRLVVARVLGILLLCVTLLALSPAASLSAPPDDAPPAVVLSVTISLYNSPTTSAERERYEEVIRFFADGVYEESNGATKLGTVLIYSGGAFAHRANVRWIGAPSVDRQRPRGSLAGMDA